MTDEYIGQQDNKFIEIYEAYGKKIYNYVLSLVRNRDDAKEIMQETFVRVYRNLSSYDESKGAWSTWIYRIARNLSFNYIKHKRYEPDASLNDMIRVGTEKMELLRIVADEQATQPVDEAHKKEINLIVRNAIEKLPCNYREVLVLCDIEGLAHQKVADILGITAHNVDVRLGRARKKIADILKSIMKEDRHET